MSWGWRPRKWFEEPKGPNPPRKWGKNVARKAEATKWAEGVTDVTICTVTGCDCAKVTAEDSWHDQGRSYILHNSWRKTISHQKCPKHTTDPQS